MKPIDRRSWQSLLLALIAGGLYLLAAAGLIYSTFCQYTWLKMQLHDYGIYTNFLWNSAHGHCFRYLLHENYLRTHLSYTLLLLAPMFHVWDHPFLLTVVQWLMGIIGSLIVAWIGRRLRMPSALTAAFMLLFLAYPFTQSTLLCEFHGVSLYFVLIPWLYACLVWRKGLVWAPYLLILGLREDAAFVILPLLLYFAAVDRWKWGYVYAVAAVVVAAVSVNLIFPQVNGVTIGERRSDLLNLTRIAASFDGAGLWNRAVPLFWLFLPAVPLLPRNWRPIFIFPSLPLLLLLASPLSYHYELQRHYPTAVFTCMVLGMLEALRRTAIPLPGPATKESRRLWLAVYLVGITLIAHVTRGEIVVGGLTRPVFLHRNMRGRAQLRAARLLPKEGVLLVDKKLCGFCANRADLITFDTLNPRKDRIDLAFFPVEILDSRSAAVLHGMLTNGAYGVTYFDGHSAILQRGAPTMRNTEVQVAGDNVSRTIDFLSTRSPQGRAVFAPGGGVARYWSGKASTAPLRLSYGASVKLPPGAYRAIFRLGARPMHGGRSVNWGRLSVHRFEQDPPLTEAEIDPNSIPANTFGSQTLRFTIEEAGQIEPRITTGDAELWLDRVIFVPEASPESAPQADTH